MVLRVSEELRSNLLEEPESGMGYQVATVDGERFLIVNTLVALSLQPRELVRRATVRTENNAIEYASLLLPDQWWWWSIGWLAKDDPKVLYQFMEQWSNREESYEIPKDYRELNGRQVTVETHGSYPSTTRSGEMLVRYSAFINDFRISEDGSVRRGTYVTTEVDTTQTPSGLAAVSRYALPNPTPAIYKFVLSPGAGVPIHCGTVAPKFGQAGGGVEVLLGGHLPAGSACGPGLIAER